ncbi:MAG: type II secretion system protein GspN [Proteobacteria bacterium]|nr:type II secretion system protein GspN [Pseudomonadota bacterium]
MFVKRLLLYLLLFLGIAYLIFVSAWTNLDPAALTPWVESRININLPRKYRADISLVETSLSGLHLNQIRVRELPSNSPVVDVEKVSLSFGLLEFLLFQEIDYSMELYNGFIEGELDLFPKKSVDFSVSELQINRNPVLRKTNLITSNPIVNGDGFYTFSENPEAEIEFDILNLSISGKPQHTNIPFELPDTKLSEFEGDIVIKGKEADILLSSKGDLAATVEGIIKLNFARPANSEFNLNLTGKLTSEFESKLGFFKSILVNYKNTTGQVAVNLSGSLQRPRVKKN